MRKIVLSSLGLFGCSISVMPIHQVIACATKDFELPNQVYSESEARSDLKLYEEELENTELLVSEELEMLQNAEYTEREIIDIKLNSKNFQWEACLEMIIVAFNYKISLFMEFDEANSEISKTDFNNLIESCKNDFDNFYAVAKNKEFYSKTTLNYIKSLVNWVLEGF